MGDMYKFVVADYCATGEGRTICMLITRAYPQQNDYVRESYFDDEGKWHYESETKNTPDARALREFVVRFGGFIAQGAELLDRETFLVKHGNMLPEIVKRMLSTADQPGNMSFSQEFHVNFS
jgi:hypothetical protein